MQRKLWQVDAFAEKPLEGNPAAIIPLDAWMDTGLMQKIAKENNLSETAFFVKTAPGKYDLRWFAPESEVDLCGHATLASAHVLFQFLDPSLRSVAFETRSGTLVVDRGQDGRYVMSLPSDPVAPLTQPELAETIGAALSIAPPKEVFQGRYLMAVWESAKDVRAIRNCGEIGSILHQFEMWGLIATAPGDDGYDFISRFFAPNKGVPEDPVTGSAHCALAPFWAKRLGKKTLKARQVSPRGGDLTCTDDGARTIISGSCALYMTGEIEI